MTIQLACACGAEMTIEVEARPTESLVFMSKWFEMHPHGEPLTFKPTYMGTAMGSHP